MERSGASSAGNDLPTREDLSAADSLRAVFDPLDELSPGHTIGRYVVAKVLGSGSMGVVYQAYDPELDRMVAVKMIRAREGLEDPSSARARLQREAQAMAKLQHPNVVAVHDVGQHHGELFIAMERIDGQTLRQWLSEPRPWAEVLEAYVAAGEGLAAAHRHGIVHRDFKPANVLKSHDGRVCVADFGLAGANRADSAAPVHSDARSLAESTLTQQGAVMGTPAYMAPELHEGAPADPRSDLYALCVSLFEGLYGRRPFGGNTMAELLKAKLAFAVEPPAKPALPRHLRQAILRGLEPEPEARWESVDALLQALRRRSHAMPWALAVVGGGALFVAGALVGDLQPEGCEDAALTVAEVWNDASRAELQRAFEATGKSYASDSAQRVARQLDAYAQQWAEARTAVCEATIVRQEQPESLMSTRMACLDLRLDGLRTLVRVLGSADEDTVRRATSAAGALDPIAPCRTVDTVGGGVRRPEDPEARQRGDQAERKLAEGQVLSDTGHYSEALAVVDEVQQRLEGQDDPAVLAHARFMRGNLLDRLGEPVKAEQVLYEAIWSAEEARDREREVRAWTKLAWVTGYRDERYEEALRHGEHARAGIASLPEAPPELEITLSNTLGSIHFAAGRYDRALALHRRALEASREALGEDDLRVGTPLINLGLTHYARNEPEAAAQRYEEALALFESALGPEHPDTALVAGNLALALHDQGEHGRAVALAERALRLRREALGEQHPSVALSLRHLGELEHCRGRVEPARAYLERALAIYDALEQPPARDRSAALTTLGELELGAGNLDDAERHFQAATQLDASLADDHPRRAASLVGLAELRLRQGLVEEARAVLDEAEPALEARGGGELRSRASFLRAQIVGADPARREQARVLAREAREGFGAILDERRDRSAEVDAWLATLDAPPPDDIAASGAPE